MDKKREVVNEAFCSFIESRAKSVSEPEKILMGSKDNTPEEHKHMFKVLDSTQKRLKKSKWQKKYYSIPYKGILYFALLVIMLIIFWVVLFRKLWLVGLIGLVITVCLSIMYIISNLRSGTNKRSGKKWNWLYKIELNLRLLLWKIPPIDNEMKNPRCVFVYFNKNDDYKDWITSKLLPKLQHDLGIKMSDEFAHLLQNADFSSSEFQEYSYWKDAVMDSRGNVPLWCFCIIILVGIPGIFVGAIYHSATWAQIFSWIGGISLTVGVCSYIFKKVTNIPTGPDNEANKQLLDIICRLHRVMRNETIFFTLVNFRGTVPPEMAKYFKFSIDFEHQDTDYHHIFYWIYDNSLSLHIVKSPAYEKLDGFLKIVLQHVRDGLSTPTYPWDPSVFSENALKFLSFLVKTNDAHNILSSIDILCTVYTDVKIDHTNTGNCMLVFTYETWEVDVSSQLTPEIHLSLFDFKMLEKDNPDFMHTYPDHFYMKVDKFVWVD